MAWTTEAVVEEMQVRRTQVLELAGRLRPEDLVRPNAAGDWTVRDVIAHFAEWDRWNFAQFRAAFDSEAPRYDGRRPEYPPGFEQPMPGDERNRMIFEAAQTRSPADVLADFDAVVAGFLAWLRERPDSDMDASLGFAFGPSGSDDPHGRLVRLAVEVPDVANAAPLYFFLVSDHPDLSQTGHWRHHLPDLQAFVEKRERSYS